MQNQKNKPGNNERNSQVKWEVGIAPTGNVYVYFSNGEQHFRCEMDGETPLKMGEALIDAYAKQNPKGNA